MAILKYKDGSDWKVASKNVAYEASGGLPAPTEEELTFSGDLSYWDNQGNWDWFITKYGDKIKTENVIGLGCMFVKSQLEEIPFTINFKSNYINYSSSTVSHFMKSSQLKKPPIILNFTPIFMSGMFYQATSLEEIPDNYFDTWDFSAKINGAMNISDSEMFRFCFRLRKIPINWLSNVKGNTMNSYSYFYNGFH